MALIRLLPRLAAAGTKLGAKGGVTGLAAAGISSIIKSLGVDQAVDAGEAALQTPMFEPIQRKEEVIEFRSPSVRDLFDEIEVKPKEIVPELGPEEDRYEKHLNLIIERVARLEGEAATQNELIARLRGTVKDSDDQQRRFNLEEKRKASEDDIEGRSRTKEAFEKIKQGAATTGRSVGAMLKALALPVAAFTASHFLNQYAEDMEGSGETIEGLVNVAERVFEVGAQLGAAVPQSFATLGRAGAAATRLGATTGTAINQVRSVAAMPGSGASLFPTATGAIAPTVSSAIQSVAPNAAKARKAVQNIGMLQRMVQGLQRGADALTGRILDWARRLPARLASFMRAAARKVLRWYLIFESFEFMFRLAERYAMGTIDEQEFHAGNKEQINNIINILGTPMLMAFLGGLVGGFAGVAIGTIVPFLGSLIGGVGATAAGKIAGLTVGILWGDKIYEFLRIDKIVDGIYDFIVHSNKEPIKNMFVSTMQWATGEAPKLLGRALLDALNPTRVIMRGITTVREKFDPAPNVDSDFERDIGPPIETPIPPLRDGVTTSVIMREGGTQEMTEEEIHAAFDEGLISIAARDSALSILERDRVREERRIAGQAINPQSTSTTTTVAQTVSPPVAEDVTINFSEFELQQADPALYEEFASYKQEVEQQHFEKRESRNVRNNRTITQANRQIARTKAHNIAAVYYQNEINNVLGSNSVVVNNQTTQNQNNIVNNQTTQNQNIVTQTNREGQTVIVPLMQPAPRYGQSLSQSIAVGPKSQLESASPTYNTSDSFLDLGLVT